MYFGILFVSSIIYIKLDSNWFINGCACDENCVHAKLLGSKLFCKLTPGNDYRVENWYATFLHAIELDSDLKNILSFLFFKLVALKVGTLFNRKWFLDVGAPVPPPGGHMNLR